MSHIQKEQISEEKQKRNVSENGPLKQGCTIMTKIIIMILLPDMVIIIQCRLLINIPWHPVSK